jgi:hypothetical protein
MLFEKDSSTPAGDYERINVEKNKSPIEIVLMLMWVLILQCHLIKGLLIFILPANGPWGI